MTPTTNATTNATNARNERNKLANREDARRLARTLVDIRNEQGENIQASTRRMQALPANVLAKYAARPKAYRTAVLSSVSNRCVVLRYSCDAR